MPSADLLAVLDTVFAALAVLCLLAARFGAIPTFNRLIKGIDDLMVARSELSRDGASLRQLANVARRMEVVARAAAAVEEGDTPSVTAILRGRRGRFDLLSNFFVRSASIQRSIDCYLVDLRAACVDRRRAAASGYASPFNPCNLPSTIAQYLGLGLTSAQTKRLDGIAWLATAMLASAVALRA